MSAINVSTVLLTRNSAASLPKYLASMAEVDDIVALDGGSTDGTLELLKAAPNVRVFSQPAEFLDDGYIVDFAGVRNYGCGLCRHPWILCVDSDEEMDESLLSEVRQIVEEGRVGVYRVRRLFTVRGEPVVTFSSSAGDQIRLFHRSAVTGWARPVHEKLILRPDVHSETLRGTITVPLPPAREVRPKYDRYLAIEVANNADISWGRWFRWLLLRNAWSTVRRFVVATILLLSPKRGPRYPLELQWEQLRYVWLLTWRTCPLVRRT